MLIFCIRTILVDPCNQAKKPMRSPVVGDADSVYYKRDTHINVQFSQVQLSQWAAGGQSSASMIAKLDQFWEYDGSNVGWDTEIHGAFGLLHRPDEDIILKTDDRIEVATKLGYRLKEQRRLDVIGSFRTQLAPGSQRSMAYQTRTKSPPDSWPRGIWWWPWAWTSSRPQPRPFFWHPSHPNPRSCWIRRCLEDWNIGVLPGETARHEVGGYVRLGLKEQVTENVTYTVRLICSAPPRRTRSSEFFGPCPQFESQRLVIHNIRLDIDLRQRRPTCLARTPILTFPVTPGRLTGGSA